MASVSPADGVLGKRPDLEPGVFLHLLLQFAYLLSWPGLKSQGSLPIFFKPEFQIGPISDTISFPDLSYKQWGHNWYILIPKRHPKAFCNAAKPALLEASDDINFSLFPEVCRKLKCRKCCGKKLKLCGKKKRKIDRK